MAVQKLFKPFALSTLICASIWVSAQIKDSVNLKEFTFTGALREMRKDDLAVPVEIYTQTYFLKNNVTNLYEAISMISGVQANIDGAVDGAGDIEINGQDGTYTLIMLDGMPVSGGNASVYSLAGISMAIIERIEVIKGPSSTVYGSDAVAGVVNVITKSPERVGKFFGDVRTTSYLETNAELGCKIPAGKATGLLTLNAYNMNTHWDKNGDNFTDIPLTNRFCAFTKWSFRNKFKMLSSVYGRYLFEDRMGGQLNFRRAFLGSDSVYGESIRTNRFEVFGNFALPIREVNLTLQTSYTDHIQSSWYGVHSFDNEERNARLQLVYDKKIHDVSDLMIGASYKFYWYTDNLHQQGDTTAGLLSHYPLVNQFPAVFIQDMIHVDRHNEILAGFRYEYNTLYKGNAFCPRVDYKWMSTKKEDIVRFGIGSGFRTPNVFIDDRYAFTNGKSIVINGDIKTELSYGAHLVYEKKINKKGTLNIESKLFFNTILNKIEADINSRPDAVIYSNDGSYNINYGANLNLDMNFHFPIRAFIGMTVMKNMNFYKNDAGETVYNDLVNTPTFNATYSISYTIRKAALTIDWTGLINSPMYLNTVLADFRPSTSPWYCLMNLQVTKKFKFGMDIYAGCNNILNFIPQNVILRPNDPFNAQVNDLDHNPHNYHFDTSYIYAPNQGNKGFLGIRWHIGT